MSKKIRVFLVDDSPVALAVLKRMLAQAQDIEVIGTAGDGQEALARIPDLKPDVICTDLNMPRLNGLELTRRVMAERPTPILVVSIAVQQEDAQNVFELLRAGAVDVFPKPRQGLSADDAVAQELINKVRVVSGVVAFTRKPDGGAGSSTARTDASASEAFGSGKLSSGAGDLRLLAMGASTGGPQAYLSVLSALPENFPLPVLCVQHISLGFLDGLVEWLNRQCALKVVIAQNGQKPAPGHIYFPPEDAHLELDAGGALVASRGPQFHGFRPSVTVLFESVARVCGPRALGVLLTGMGDDGAAGLKAMRDAGGVTIAQDEKTSTVYGMPREAARIGAAVHILPLPEIAPALKKIAGV
jgi:two-component system chemotaxis response regulator CheB